jgi:hypothetical protein
MYPANYPVYWPIDALAHVLDYNAKNKSNLTYLKEALKKQQTDLEGRLSTAEQKVTSLLEVVETVTEEQVEQSMNESVYAVVCCLTNVEWRGARIEGIRSGSSEGTLCALDRQINDQARAAGMSRQILTWIGSLKRTEEETAMHDELAQVSRQRDEILEQFGKALPELKTRISTVVTQLALAREKQLRRFSPVDDAYVVAIQLIAAEISERIGKVKTRWVENYSPIYGEFEGERYYASKSIFTARDCMFSRNLEEARLRAGGAVLAALRLVTENMAHLELGYYVIYHDLWISNQRALQVMARVDLLLNAMTTLAKTTDVESLQAVSDRVRRLRSECDELAGKVAPYEQRMSALFESLGHLRDDLMVREGLIKRTGERPPVYGGGGKFRVISCE